MGPVALRGYWVRWAHRAGSAPLLSRRRRPAASPSLLGPRSWAKASLRASLHLSSTLRLSGPAAAEMLARQLLTSLYCIKFLHISSVILAMRYRPLPVQLFTQSLQRLFLKGSNSSQRTKAGFSKLTPAPVAACG